MLYSLDKKNIKISPNFPTFVLSWLNYIVELSKLGISHEVFNLYVR
jgi:hypothetical protein